MPKKRYDGTGAASHQWAAEMAMSHGHLRGLGHRWFRLSLNGEDCGKIFRTNVSLHKRCVTVFDGAGTEQNRTEQVKP